MFVFLEDIRFRYKGAQASVLDGFSLFVRSGEIVAIVGPAGAGKTTLLRYVGKRSDGQGGRIVQYGTPEEIQNAPANEFVARI